MRYIELKHEGADVILLLKYLLVSSFGGVGRSEEQTQGG